MNLVERGLPDVLDALSYIGLGELALADSLIQIMPETCQPSIFITGSYAVHGKHEQFFPGIAQINRLEFP